MTVSHVCDGCGTEIATDDRVVLSNYTGVVMHQMDFCGKCAARIRNTVVVKEAMKAADA